MEPTPPVATVAFPFAGFHPHSSSATVAASSRREPSLPAPPHFSSVSPLPLSAAGALHQQRVSPPSVHLQAAGLGSTPGRAGQAAGLGMTPPGGRGGHPGGPVPAIALFHPAGTPPVPLVFPAPAALPADGSPAAAALFAAISLALDAGQDSVAPAAHPATSPAPNSVSPLPAPAFDTPGALTPLEPSSVGLSSQPRQDSPLITASVVETSTDADAAVVASGSVRGDSKAKAAKGATGLAAAFKDDAPDAPGASSSRSPSPSRSSGAGRTGQDECGSVVDGVAAPPPSQIQVHLAANSHIKVRACLRFDFPGKIG